MMSGIMMMAGMAGASYLLGAVPFGFLVARARGVDIRKVGSGNIGATNVFRSVGKSWGILTFICDLLKGFLPAFLFPVVWLKAGGAAAQGAPVALMCGAAAIVGHNWPVYLGFKGGKGVATSAGVLLGLAPLSVAAGVLVFGVVFGLSRYVSVGSIAAAVVVAASGWWFYAGEGRLRPSALTLLAALIIWRHKSNIRRLMDGTEHRFQFGRKK
jgi:glycerol-3-phosphate acyltransferase PlsY